MLRRAVTAAFALALLGVSGCMSMEGPAFPRLRSLWNGDNGFPDHNGSANGPILEAHPAPPPPPPITPPEATMPPPRLVPQPQPTTDAPPMPYTPPKD